MSLVGPFFMFSIRLAAGIMFGLLFISPQVGGSFFRFNSLIAFAGLALAAGAVAGSVFSGALFLSRDVYWLLFILLAVLVLAYNLAVSLDRQRTARVLLYAAAGSGVLLLSFAFLVAPDFHSLLAALASLASALLLGSVSLAMILGHWYLVDPSLSIAHLKRLSLLFGGAVLARISLLVTTLLYYLFVVEREAVAELIDPFYHGTFFWTRALAGLAGPLVLSLLVWKTVKMRATMSATGLLYVAVILVLIGELIATYLFARTAVPV